MPVGIVVEGYGGVHGKGITDVQGKRDAEQVLKYLPTVGIPLHPSTVIWFSVDTDIGGQVPLTYNDVLMYFRAINLEFEKISSIERPRIGVYGSGSVCRRVINYILASVTWLAGSTRWANYAGYVASEAWTLSQKIHPGERWNGYACDTNIVNDKHGSPGLWVPFALHPATYPVGVTGSVQINPPGTLGPQPPPSMFPETQKNWWNTLVDSFKKL
jgi:hypothetical protein